MTTQQVQGPGATGGAAAPPVDPDAAAYAALAKELEIEEQGTGGGDGAETDGGRPAPSAESEAQPGDKGKPAPTELDNLKAALKEARDAHKAEQARTDAILAALREAKERRGQREAETTEQPKPPKLPEVQEDPIGHFNARIAQLEELLKQSQQGGQLQAQQLQAQLHEQAMWSAVQASEAAIRDPKSGDGYKADYDDACRFLEGARIKQLERMYPSASPQVQAYARQQGYQDANQLKLALLNQDRRSVAIHALQTGISPAELYYNLAIDSGYQPKPNGKGPAQASLAERAKQQIEAAKKGTKAAVTLSGGSGSRKGADDMSISDLADLFVEDPDAADKVWEQMRRAGKLG
jgi:hypothetical protein